MPDTAVVRPRRDRGRAGRRNAAVTAALLGKPVAVVEKAAVVGGAAVNTGTIPSKTLRETALALSGLRSRDLYGVDLSLRREATIDDFLRHERAVKATERGPDPPTSSTGSASRSFHGTGSFARPAHRPASPDPAGRRDAAARREDRRRHRVGPGPPAAVPVRAQPRPRLGRTARPARRCRESLAVVGAGVIGSEYACMFAALGVPTST